MSKTKKRCPIYQDDNDSGASVFIEKRCLKIIDLLVKSIKELPVYDPDGSIRGKYFDLFDNNPVVEECLLIWLERNYPKPETVVPDYLNNLIYRVGREAFRNVTLLSYYFPRI